ncbi:MAG: hypothetical protein WBL21_12875 [Salinimicrobium sp.]
MKRLKNNAPAVVSFPLRKVLNPNEKQKKTTGKITASCVACSATKPEEEFY